MRLLDALALVKLGYMLETLSIRRYSVTTNSVVTSDNPFGAGNQQERPETVANCKLTIANCKLFLESSETIRQASTKVVEDIVRAAWRHAEIGRNDQSA